MPPTRTRSTRIEFRTTAATRDLIDQACLASGTRLTDFAEHSLVMSAQQVLADRRQFMLSPTAQSEWESVNSRPARDLPSLLALFERPSPFK
jgi:uncharacterized protein (DUF1778 family)